MEKKEKEPMMPTMEGVKEKEEAVSPNTNGQTDAFRMEEVVLKEEGKHRRRFTKWNEELTLKKFRSSFHIGDEFQDALEVRDHLPGALEQLQHTLNRVSEKDRPQALKLVQDFLANVLAYYLKEGGTDFKGEEAEEVLIEMRKKFEIPPKVILKAKQIVCQKFIANNYFDSLDEFLQKYDLKLEDIPEIKENAEKALWMDMLWGYTKSFYEALERFGHLFEQKEIAKIVFRGGMNYIVNNGIPRKDGEYSLRPDVRALLEKYEINPETAYSDEKIAEERKDAGRDR